MVTSDPLHRSPIPTEIPMATDTILEGRLTIVEAAVAEIQKKLASQSPTPTSDWVERFDGAFKDEPAFAEVVAYGPRYARGRPTT